MKLSTITIYALHGMSVPEKLELARAIDCAGKTLYKYIVENKPNGPLTTKAALDFMTQKFQVSQNALFADRIVELPGGGVSERIEVEVDNFNLPSLQGEDVSEEAAGFTGTDLDAIE